MTNPAFTVNFRAGGQSRQSYAELVTDGMVDRMVVALDTNTVGAELIRMTPGEALTMAQVLTIVAEHAMEEAL